jgi:hypothetical protein
MLQPKKKITKQSIMDETRFLRSQNESKVTKKFSDIAKDAEKSSFKKYKKGGTKTSTKKVSKKY